MTKDTSARRTASGNDDCMPIVSWHARHSLTSSGYHAGPRRRVAVSRGEHM